MGFSSLQHLQSLIAKITAMLLKPFLNGLGNNLHHTESVERAKYLKPIVRLFPNPTGHGLFHKLKFPP
jgi:hypothetical protein